MSDAGVTLAWMKYINSDQLFHDGIYPQGFSIYLATLQKLAAIDPLYIIKYTGPMNGLLMGFTLYFVISRLTKKPYVGLFAFFFYGVLSCYLPLEIDRQVATNSEEFGFIFILPTIFFLYEYMKTGQRSNLRIAFYGLTITALVHQVAFAFAFIGVLIVLALSVIVIGKESISRIKLTFLFGVLAGVISSLPLLIGFLAGKRVHSSSYEFLVAQITEIGYPEIGLLSRIALCCIGFLFLYILIYIRSLKKVFAELFVFSFSGIAFLVYYYAGVLTQNQMIASRFTSLWGLILLLPICLVISILIGLLGSNSRETVICALSISALLGLSLLYFRPQAIVPYKMQRNSDVEQYYLISQTFEPTKWTIVSQTEGYSLALGKGYHIMMSDFIKWYDPSNPNSYLVNQESDQAYKSPDVFIFFEKKIFTTSFESMASIYEQRRLDNQQMKEWIKEFKIRHHNISVFYEDEESIVYRIHQDFEPKQETY